MIRTLLFLALASTACAQALLPPPAERPRVFEIGKTPATASDKKPMATAAVVPAEPAPLMEVVAEGWELMEISKTGNRMNDGFLRPSQPTALVVVDGPSRGQLTIISNHAAGVRQEDLPAGTKIPQELIFKNQDTEKGGITRTVIEAKTGKVLRQEMALLGTFWNSAGMLTASGNFLSGEIWDGADKHHGRLFQVDPLSRGLASAVALPLPWKLSLKVMCIDEASQMIYLAESADETLVYRWKPTLWKDLALGGTLYVMTVQNPDRALGQPELTLSPQKAYTTYWRELPRKVEGSFHDAALKLGAAKFFSIEGLAVRGNELWMSVRTNVPSKMQLAILKGDKLSAYAGAADNPIWPESLTLAPTGELLVVDNHAPQRLMMLSREGQWKTLFKLNSGDNSTSTSIKSAAVSRDGQWIFMNVETGKGSSLVALRRAK